MGDRQGKENGFCFCGHAGLFHNGLHDLFLLCSLCDDKDHFFFSSECNTKEFSHTLHTSAFCMDYCATASASAACCLHDRLGISLVCDGYNHFIFCILQDGFLLIRFNVQFLGEIGKQSTTADTA